MTEQAVYEFGLRGPDADDLVWLTYARDGQRGFVRLGSRGSPQAELALRTSAAGSAALGQAFGHLAKRPEPRSR